MRFFAALCLVAAVWQNPAVLRGTAMNVKVTDTRGDVLPGGTVTVRVSAGSRTRSVVSDRYGRAQFPDLVPGNYDVIASLMGFDAVRLNRVMVSRDQVLQADIQLELSLVC